MRILAAIFVILVLLSGAGAVVAGTVSAPGPSSEGPSSEHPSVEGHWRTIDDETGEARSIVHLWSDDGELKGRIVELLNPPEPNPVCVACSGKLKDQPIKDMVFLWGLRPRRDEWVDGRIVDPNNGKQYGARVKLIEGGARLEVRGYLGIALLGRTQVWERAARTNEFRGH